MIAGRFETEIVGDELQSRSIEIAGRIIREAIACKNRQTHRHSQGRPEPRHPRQQTITHARASLKARKNKKTAQEKKAGDSTEERRGGKECVRTCRKAWWAEEKK